MPEAETLEALIARAAPDAIEVVAGDVRCCRIARVDDDSRRVGPGTLFVARPGVAGDGAAYVRAAIEAGAVAVLSTQRALQPHPKRAIVHQLQSHRVTKPLLGSRP